VAHDGDKEAPADGPSAWHDGCMTERQLKTAAWAWWIFGAVVGVIVIIAGVSASVLEPIQLATGVPLIVVYGFYLARKMRASYLSGLHDEAPGR
jgi:hypothetical protein